MSAARVLLERLIDAHGGRERWKSVRCVEFSLSSAGLAFSLHMQGSALLGLQARVYPHARRVELRDYGQPGGCGVWTPDRVWLLDTGGNELRARDAPRAQFSRWSRQVRWDDLDMLYFAGYALWNYLSFPFLLEEPGVHLGEVLSVPGGFRLEAAFAPGFPTHSARQSFHVDASGGLLRHDYVADVIGPWAAAANLSQASVQVDGLRFYTRRRVFPRLGVTTVLPWPTLVWIEIDGLRWRSGPGQPGAGPADGGYAPALAGNRKLV